MRKPYVAGQYIYSNQLISRDVEGKGIKNELPLVAEKGFLRATPWIPEHLRNLTEGNQLEAGELLVKMSCSHCHSLEKTGVYRPLQARLQGMPKEGIKAIIDSIGEGAFVYMPKLVLPEDEKEAMAAWLAAQNY